MRRCAALCALLLLLAACSGGATAEPRERYEPPARDWPPDSVLEVREPSVPRAPVPTTEEDAAAYASYLVRAVQYSLRTTYVSSPLRQDCSMCERVQGWAEDAVADRVLFRKPFWGMGPPQVYLLEQRGEARLWGVYTLGTRAVMNRVDEAGRKVDFVQGDVELWAFQFFAENGEWHLVEWSEVDENPFRDAA